MKKILFIWDANTVCFASNFKKFKKPIGEKSF